MKARVIVKNDYELPELTYEQGGEVKGGFTLLESPAEQRVYIIDTSSDILNSIKADTEKYEWLEDIEEGV